MDPDLVDEDDRAIQMLERLSAAVQGGVPALEKAVQRLIEAEGEEQKTTHTIFLAQLYEAEALMRRNPADLLGAGEAAAGHAGLNAALLALLNAQGSGRKPEPSQDFLRALLPAVQLLSATLGEGEGPLARQWPFLTLSRVCWQNRELAALAVESGAAAATIRNVFRGLDYATRGGVAVAAVDAPPVRITRDGAALAFRVASFGSADGKLELARVVETEPPHANAELENAASLKGKVALVMRGRCTFADKVRRCQDAGAAAVLIVADQLITPAGDGCEVSIPVLCVTEDALRLALGIQGELWWPELLLNATFERRSSPSEALHEVALALHLMGVMVASCSAGGFFGGDGGDEEGDADDAGAVFSSRYIAQSGAARAAAMTLRAYCSGAWASIEDSREVCQSCGSEAASLLALLATGGGAQRRDAVRACLLEPAASAGAASGAAAVAGAGAGGEPERERRTCSPSKLAARQRAVRARRAEELARLGVAEEEALQRISGPANSPKRRAALKVIDDAALVPLLRPERATTRQLLLRFVAEQVGIDEKVTAGDRSTLHAKTELLKSSDAAAAAAEAAVMLSTDAQLLRLHELCTPEALVKMLKRALRLSLEGPPANECRCAFAPAHRESLSPRWAGEAIRRAALSAWVRDEVVRQRDGIFPLLQKGLLRSESRQKCLRALYDVSREPSIEAEFDAPVLEDVLAPAVGALQKLALAHVAACAGSALEPLAFDLLQEIAERVEPKLRVVKQVIAQRKERRREEEDARREQMLEKIITDWSLDEDGGLVAQLSSMEDVDD